MSVYRYLDYRLCIKELFEARQTEPGQKWTLRRLAALAGVQPSFVTNALKGRAEFSADQVYAIADALRATADERRYLVLALEHQRSINRARKQELRAELDELRMKHSRTEKHLALAKPVQANADDLAEYYMDPFAQVAHVFLGVPSSAASPDSIADALGVSKARLAAAFAVLERVGYARREKGKWILLERNKHLPKDSPLCGPHQTIMRMKSIDQLQRLAPDAKYSFSATFSGTEETRAQIQDAFLAFLKKAEAIVGEAESKSAFQMNFDLFPWAAR